MKISNFDKPTIKALRQSMDAALAKVSKEYGITITAGNARFTANEVTFKVKANTMGTGGKAITKESQAWGIHANLHGLGHLSIGDSVELQGKSFSIKGWNTRARKSPINIEDNMGRGYKCSVSMLKMYNPITA